MTRHYLALLWVGLSFGLLYTPFAGATDILDQSQTAYDNSVVVTYDTQYAQIFTAGSGVYGSLDRVSLYLENNTSSPPLGLVTVSIQTVIGGLPSGKQIGSGTILLSAIPPLYSPGWVDVTINDAVVSAGTQYAIVLQTSTYTSARWGYANTSYSGGEMAFNDGNSWTLSATENFTFKTYVVPDTLDQSQSWENFEDMVSGAGNPVAQSFIPGLSGKLDRVRAKLDNSNAAGAVVATIQTVSGWYPSGTVIGQGSVPASSLPPYQNPNLITIAIGGGGAAVSAGTRYALVLEPDAGQFLWSTFVNPVDVYTRGELLFYDSYSGWMPYVTTYSVADAVFETYIATPVVSAPPPPPPTVTPCSGICPAVRGSVTPNDSTARITSNVHFQELSDGTVRGNLNFNDSKTGNFVLHACTTTSAECRLTVTTLACTDQHAITVAGTYTRKGQSTGNYLLTLNGVGNGIGTFVLSAGDYTYTLVHAGIVDVTCPTAEGQGQR